MGKKDSDFDKGRAQGHKDATHNTKHPWSTGAGFGKTKPSGKSDEYSGGYDRGKEQAKKGK